LLGRGRLSARRALLGRLLRVADKNPVQIVELGRSLRLIRPRAPSASPASLLGRGRLSALLAKLVRYRWLTVRPVPLVKLVGRQTPLHQHARFALLVPTLKLRQPPVKSVAQGSTLRPNKTAVQIVELGRFLLLLRPRAPCASPASLPRRSRRSARRALLGR